MNANDTDKTTTLQGHTPGPWRKAMCGDGFYLGEIRGPVGTDYEHDVVADWVGEANASLISAAPDMLEALRYYRDQMCEGFCVDLRTRDDYSESMDFHCAGCKARAAIAKAEGRG